MTHYDYAVQVWVQNGVVVPCSHPSWMRRHGITCCHAWTHQGRPIRDVRAELLVTDGEAPRDHDRTVASESSH